MTYLNLKQIPELNDLSVDELNKLVKEVYRADRRLRLLNILNGLVIGFCFPISMLTTEQILGYSSVFKSMPFAFILALVFSFLFSRMFICPRFAMILRTKVLTKNA